MMTDKPTGAPSPSTGADPSGTDRRQGDRRRAEAPFEGPDRRQKERRSGTDRRSTPRGDTRD